MKAMKKFFICFFVWLGIISLALTIIGLFSSDSTICTLGLISSFFLSISIMMLDILASPKDENKRFIYFDDLDGVG